MKQYIIWALIVSFVGVSNCIAYDRTEAQRFYDLSLSYMKSGLYTQGLETLNQVAFLYPESDVADEALYQLAILRERSGDGEITLGEARANSINSAMVDKVSLNIQYAPNNFDGVMQGIIQSLGDLVIMSGQKRAEIEAQKIQAINEYLLAIDYLNTAFERYPESDIDIQLEKAYQRITSKLDILTQPISTVKKTYGDKYRRNKIIIFITFLVITGTALWLTQGKQ